MNPGNLELLEQFMNHMTDVIFFKDRNGRFLLINDAGAKWMGFSSSEDGKGKTDFDVFEPEFARLAHIDEQRIIKTGKAMVGKEESLIWKGGATTWVSTSKIPLRDQDGNIAGCIGIARDITDIKRKEAELQATTEKLQQANAKLRKAQDQIAEDLEMAAQLQQTFHPHTYPSFTSPEGVPLLDFHFFYEADSQIGGDFCGVYELDEHRAGLLICDAMGHGVRAALITGIIRVVSENIARRTNSPGDFLTTMNRRLHPMLQTRDDFLFATACFLVVDTRTGKLSGAIAGHPLPYLIRPHERTADFLPIPEDVPGPALAITPDYEYDSFEVTLNEGDEVLLYTDGMVEALNEKGEEFGNCLLQQVLVENCDLPLKDLFPRLIEAAKQHTQSIKLGDDTCLLGVSYNRPAKS